MALIGIDDLPDHGAILGLDVGRVRVGVAVSDPGQRVASPLTTLPRKPGHGAPFLLRLCALYDERDCCGVVVGLPLNMDGSAGAEAQSVRAFCRNSLAHRDLPMAFWDERLTTRAAERALLESDTSRRRRQLRIDSVAACIILQTALDYLTTASDSARP